MLFATYKAVRNSANLKLSLHAGIGQTCDTPKAEWFATRLALQPHVTEEGTTHR